MGQHRSTAIGRIATAITAATLTTFLGVANAQEPKEDRPPFTGFLKIKQKDGSLIYEIAVIRGKVVSGSQGWEGNKDVGADIVGGWFDRDRLVLMISIQERRRTRPVVLAHSSHEEDRRWLRYRTHALRLWSDGRGWQGLQAARNRQTIRNEK